MKKTEARVVLVTAPDLRTARRLAKGALEAKLAACANLIRGIESHYWWQGKLDKGREVLVLFKTAERQLCDLEANILENHPYDTPEFVVLPISSGNSRYLSWISDSLK